MYIFIKYDVYIIYKIYLFIHLFKETGIMTNFNYH